MNKLSWNDSILFYQIFFYESLLWKIDRAKDSSKNLTINFTSLDFENSENRSDSDSWRGETSIPVERVREDGVLIASIRNVSIRASLAGCATRVFQDERPEFLMKLFSPMKLTSVERGDGGSGRVP